ncbi:hypothetical protein SAMN04489761_1550 [Tenacibaculum sp. MAR_2009_124]|uniref:hypothetical protein n=1 Tax=Tenacibaculum sp. MAR_2009_124 TaxID=1250059 RepID=UPI00089B3594|nr:hypothetical protein [Tenacibaculum sp. MAR_2009_124]SEB71747.1 hypothetical protein SAMN04489761_1550 [Tenacibaculum sp. MAR_2009_124]
MKKINLFFATISIVLLASCSSNEGDINTLQNIDNAEASQLKSYTLKRNADGSYYMDFDVAKNTQIDTYKNADNSNEVVLSEGNQVTVSRQGTQFTLDNNLLKVNILEAKNGKKSYISIEDDGINKSGRGVTEFLYDYSITKNIDGTFTLDFEVNNNVTTDFVYDDESETYEIHLESGKTKNKRFSRTLNVSTNKILKIDFVNHKYSGRSNKVSMSKKPILVVGSLGDSPSIY